jgi:hypothetical protein
MSALLFIVAVIVAFTPASVWWTVLFLALAFIASAIED